MKIKEYLKDNLLLCDGAMGTYYSLITENDVQYCELGNINNKEVIKKIHQEYIEAGAKLIRTNTFSANTIALEKTREEIKEIIVSGIDIAREAARKSSIFIGASIGPIRADTIENADEVVLDEYKFIVDIFLENGIDIFLFETLSSDKYLKEISEYIKKKNEDSFIITNFAIIPDGFSRDGIRGKRIFENIKNIKTIDSFGVNCGSGPTATIRNISSLKADGKIICAMPNAGYPMIVNERTLFTNSPKYFASKMMELKGQGVSILGGCCGTSPKYIKALSRMMDKPLEGNITKAESEKKNATTKHIENSFMDKLKNNEFVTAIELSAPIDTDIVQLMEGAKLCKESGVDLVTVPDSPMSRVRADSVIIASKVKREIGIDVMPHMCCRDKNTNAIRSTILGAHIEDIRNILVITGDPVSDAKRSETKSVFNLNSYKLMELIKDSNEEVFNGEEISIGGALNFNVVNKESEYSRMIKKIENGASFFLTQPIYEEETIEFLKEVKKRRSDIKILGGIMPLVTYKNAVFLNNELPGVTIPENLINKFSKDMSKEEAEKVGIEIAVDIGNKLKEICDGLYFITPFKRVGMLIKIIEKINN